MQQRAAAKLDSLDEADDVPAGDEDGVHPVPHQDERLDQGDDNSGLRKRFNPLLPRVGKNQQNLLQLACAALFGIGNGIF